MSTRSQVVIKDSFGDEIVFYRHSDGYPEGAMPTLQIFMDWVRSGKIRNNAEQSAGWLIIIGAIEYGTIPEYQNGNANYGDISTIEKLADDGAYNWKAGAYEPSTCRHGDIEYLYILDLVAKTISCYSTPFAPREADDETTFPGEHDKLLFIDSAENPWKAKAS